MPDLSDPSLHCPRCSYPVNGAALACPESGCDWTYPDQPQPAQHPADKSTWRLWVLLGLVLGIPLGLGAVQWNGSLLKHFASPL